jgi:hypothetical protein
MSVEVETLIACQTALLAALDAGDVAALEEATARVAAAVSAVRAQGGWGGDAHQKDRIAHALKQAEAARTRVNFLTDRTRQRIERLSEMRGQRIIQTYGNQGKISDFKP